MLHIYSTSGRRWLTVLRQLCTLAAMPKLEGSPSPELYKRLSKLGSTGGSVSQTLNQYIMEGKAIQKSKLETCVRQLRKYKRFQHALEIMEWMQMRKVNFSRIDYAVRLDLISKAKGMAEAEDYFNNLPAYAKNQLTFGALLNCYCKELMENKALALFEKMDKLNYLSNLAFNNLMSLYMRIGQPAKVQPLVDDMKQRNIPLSNFTYSIWMNSYSSMNNIGEVERVFEQMKRDDKDKINWKTFSNLAASYAKAELLDKTELALVKLEEMMKPHDREAYHFMIGLYAKTCNVNQVHRVWNLLRSAITATNMSYLVLLQALRNLKDVDGLTKFFNEWKCTCSSYDIRLANVAISAYLSQNLHDEAVLVFEDAIKSQKEPLRHAREMFMAYYLETCQIENACNQLKALMSESKDKEWKLSPKTVSSLKKYFQEEKGSEGANKFYRILNSSRFMNSVSNELFSEA